MKTSYTILLTLALVLTLLLLLVNRPSATERTKSSDGTGASGPTIAVLERQIKHRQQKMAQGELLKFELPLDTELQRQEFYDRLLRQSPRDLYQAWKDSLGSDKERHKGLLEIALADALKQADNSLDADAKTVYAEAAKFLSDPNQSESSKIRMVKWLGGSGTPEALAILLDSLDPATKELKIELLRQITAVGNSRWNRIDSERLSALLRPKWNEAVAFEPPDVRLLSPIAQALAKVGHPDGIKLLLDEVARSVVNRDARSVIAFTSFKEIRNDASVPALAAALSSQAPDSAVLIAAGEGLAAIGNEASTIPLIKWAESVDDEYAEVAAHIFSTMWHPVAIKKAGYVFIENEPFRSEKVRTAVQTALAHLQKQ